MLSTCFIFKRLPNPETGEFITKVAWNKVDGWLAYAGSQGMLRIVMLETVDTHDFNMQGIAARPSRISIERKVPIHDGHRVTALSWDEQQEHVTSGDEAGAVVVCEYKDSKWSSILVNESVQQPVIGAIWASDASKILIFYKSGQVLLGAQSGHKILAAQVKKTDDPTFAFVADSRFDFFVVGFETSIVGFNFDASERYKIQVPIGEKIMSGALVEFRDKEEPKLVTITQSGCVMIFNAATGVKIAQQQVPIIPSEISVSPNNQYIAISGQSLEPHRQLELSSGPTNTEFQAVVKLLRFCDLETVAQIRIPSKMATCVTWDASSLRLAIGTDQTVFLACLRLSYRHYMLRDGTVAFSLGSSIVKSSSQITNQKDECIIFYKGIMHKRWPQNFIEQCACGEYLAMVVGRSQMRPDGTTRQQSSIVLHSSVGAPVLSLDLTFVPFFMAGSEHYLVVANASRITLLDIRYLTGETKDYQNILESRLDQGQTYTGVVEWHADSSPFAPDRDLQVVKTQVSSPITALSVSNTALFIARQNAVVYRFSLPSLQSNVKINTGVQLKAIRGNCNGTSLAGVTEEGMLHVYFAEDFAESEQVSAERLQDGSSQTKAQKKQADKKKLALEIQQAPQEQDDLTKLLGYDAEVHVDKKAMQVVTSKDTQVKQALPPWETQISDCWGIVWNTEDPGLLAASSKHKMFVLNVSKRTREEPINTSAHLLAFRGLQLHGVYLDEMVMYGEPKEGSSRIFDTQHLRELKDILYGKQTDETAQSTEGETQRCLITLFQGDTLLDQDITAQRSTNLNAAMAYLKTQQSIHPHLFKLIAEAALKELALDTASTNYVRAGDYVAYHFTEYIRKIGSEDLRKAEVAVFLGDFKAAEDILVKQLGRPDISLKNDEQLACWLKIIQHQKDSEFNPQALYHVSDELATLAYKQAGLYFLRQRDYAQAVSMLQRAKDVDLLIEAYFRSEMYGELRQLAQTLPVDVNREQIIAASSVLARIGDVEGSTRALLRLNMPEEAIKTCITLKRFDSAVLIAQEFNLLEVVDRHLSEYLKQLLSSGDDKAALDLLRKTNQGEIAACIIIGAAMEDLEQAIQERQFPLKPGAFNRLRRLVVLAAKEAAEVQRRNITRELKAHTGGTGDMLTAGAVDKALDDFANDNVQAVPGAEAEIKQNLLENQLFQRFGNKAKSVATAWKLVRQTRFIVLSSYMLYVGKPEAALFPAIEASGYYQKQIQNVGNIHAVTDDESRALAKIALPIAILAALQIKDFDLASQLLEVVESDESLPSIERDQLEQLAVDIFHRFPPIEPSGIDKETQLLCPKCQTYLPKYCTLCQCGYQHQLCARTGVPISKKHTVQVCATCRSTSTVGKQRLTVCPMCHDELKELK